MNYKAAEKYLLEQLPMFQRTGAAAYRADLGNIIRLCELTGHPEKGTKFIHVAGTNGKGAVSHLIASILQAQGYKVGLFTSPHYKSYRERIKVDGAYIEEDFVAEYITKWKPRFSKLNASFFEISTVMALDYFKHEQVDFAVMEVGMGGRLDSTNIITPILSVITNISFDHQQFLGDTLTAIAHEKAGIIKPFVPVVIGESSGEVRKVFRRQAAVCKADITFADDLYKVELQQRKRYYRYVEINRGQQQIGRYLTDFQGEYQHKNIATAMCAIEVLRSKGVHISFTALRKGIRDTRRLTSFFGRWSIMNLHPLVIFDSAHNEAGVENAMKALREYVCRDLFVVYGCVADKDIAPILRQLPVSATYFFCKPDIPRGRDAKDLQREAARHGLKGKAYKSVADAYTAARKAAVKSDIVLVAGSVFVVAELL